MFLQEMNEETDRKEKGHSNAGKESGGVEACSGHSGLPKTLDHPARGYQSTDPVAGLPMHSPHWPSLASLRLCSWATTHTHIYTPSTDSSTNQTTQSPTPASPKSRMSFPPGIKSQAKSGASEQGGGEEERTA